MKAGPAPTGAPAVSATDVSSTDVSSADVARPDLVDRVQTVLTVFLAEQASMLESIGSDLAPVREAISEFLLDGGKRLRPTFAYWGYRGAGGTDDDGIVRAAASLELLHACALIPHDG